MLGDPPSAPGPSQPLPCSPRARGFTPATPPELVLLEVPFEDAPASSLPAPLWAAASFLPVPPTPTRAGKVGTQGRRWLRFSLREFQRPGRREPHFLEIHDSSGPFLHTSPQLHSSSSPPPAPAHRERLHAFSSQPGVHSGFCFLRISH